RSREAAADSEEPSRPRLILAVTKASRYAWRHIENCDDPAILAFWRGYDDFVCAPDRQVIRGEDRDTCGPHLKDRRQLTGNRDRNAIDFGHLGPAIAHVIDRARHNHV